eukprot:TRINITY_DN34657_c0_g2_i1.p1 TRINITY_DN34657_c0_g2~~TRINITY_DN34657_c0_g2_i1.p1  ORF type:complete len:647 (-),score=124.19 TRINITY_DN34657_c0_g2_i1:265-2205(-)
MGRVDILGPGDHLHLRRDFNAQGFGTSPTSSSRNPAPAPLATAASSAYAGAMSPVQAGSALGWDAKFPGGSFVGHWQSGGPSASAFAAAGQTMSSQNVAMASPPPHRRPLTGSLESRFRLVQPAPSPSWPPQRQGAEGYPSSQERPSWQFDSGKDLDERLAPSLEWSLPRPAALDRLDSYTRPETSLPEAPPHTPQKPSEALAAFHRRLLAASGSGTAAASSPLSKQPPGQVSSPAATSAARRDDKETPPKDLDPRIVAGLSRRSGIPTPQGTNPLQQSALGLKMPAPPQAMPKPLQMKQSSSGSAHHSSSSGRRSPSSTRGYGKSLEQPILPPPPATPPFLAPSAQASRAARRPPHPEPEAASLNDLVTSVIPHSQDVQGIRWGLHPPRSVETIEFSVSAPRLNPALALRPVEDFPACCRHALEFLRHVPTLPRTPAPLRGFLPPRSPMSAPRRTLVLDLDETLVHCRRGPNGAVAPPNGGPAPDFIVQFDGHKEPFGGVLFRPNVELFLETVSKSFEVVVFTASQQAYADKVCDALDPRGKLISHRLYRPHCTEHKGAYFKELGLLGRPLSQCILVDNSPISLACNADNGILCKSWYGDRSDEELENLAGLLQDILEVRPDDVATYLSNRYGLSSFFQAVRSTM